MREPTRHLDGKMAIAGSRSESMLPFNMKRKRYQFSKFTFETASGLLRRDGREVGIPQQTGRLLALLLDWAGDVVTREQIYQALWPNGEFLDYEQATNRAIKLLREVLRDDAQNPKFIKTFHKRGYCFLAPVTLLPDESLADAQPSAPTPASEAAVATLAVDARVPVGLTDANSSEIAAQAAAATAAVSPAALDARPHATENFAVPVAPWKPHGTAYLTKLRALRRFNVIGWVTLSIAAMGVAALLATRGRFVPRQPLPASVLSLGVAPMAAEGPQEKQLAESFRLDLMDTLSQLPGLQLRASHSVERAAYDSANPGQLAREMNLDLLLLGRLSMQGDKCLLQFELVRARDSVHLASFQYSGTRSELATIREQVQHDVFTALDLTQRPVQTAHGSTQNPAAYRAYLRARALNYHRTRESVDQALQQYRVAIDHDPTFARAYAGMASAYIARHYFSQSPDDRRLAEQASRTALALDSNLAEAHATLGMVLFTRDWNYKLAEGELRQAIDAEPYQASHHIWLSELLVFEGRFDESLAQIDLAHADDPLWPQVYNVEIPVAGSARDYNRALKAAQRYLQLEPGVSNVRDQLAWTYFAMGRYEDSIKEWHEMAVTEQDPWRASFEDEGLKALHAGGVTAYAKLRLKAANEDAQHIENHPNDFSLAEWEAFLGQDDLALTHLERQVAAHDEDAMNFAVNSMFDHLHSNPRFQALLHQVGLKLPANYRAMTSP